MQFPFESSQTSNSGSPIKSEAIAGSPPRRRWVMPAWFALGVLGLLLALVLSRNVEEYQSPAAHDTSDLVEKTQEAVRDTKIAFSEFYADRPLLPATAVDLAPDHALAPDHPANTTRKPRLSDQTAMRPHSPANPHARPSKSKRPPVADIYGHIATRAIDESVQKWQEIAYGPYSTAGAWRRLGITLFLFHRSGGLEALRHIASLPPPARPARATKSRRFRTVEAGALSRKDEAALWEGLYGRQPLRPADVGPLREKLQRLQLGWFEDIASAQLYGRAGMYAEADRAARRAHAAADRVPFVLGIEVSLLVLGTILLMGYGILWLIRKIDSSTPQPRQSLPMVTPQALPGRFTAPPGFVPVVPPLPASVVESHPISLPAAPPVQFSYRARMIAFVIYFAAYLVISWCLGFLAPLVSAWSNTAVLRLEMMIGVLVYFPVTATTLAALKAIVQAENRTRVTWRALLSALGVRSDRPGRDLLAGCLTYSMTLPFIVVAGLLSQFLFHRFHTPVHPVDLIILSTQDRFTRILLVLQACVGAPIVEELMFRGLLFQGMRQRWGVWAGAALSAAVFALSHNTLPGGFLSLWTLGFSFALIYRRSNSLLPNILAHAINNGMVTALMFTVFS